MFFVYGLNGSMYQGSHERLSKIAAVRSTQRPSSLRSNADEGAARQTQGQGLHTSVQRRNPEDDEDSHQHQQQQQQGSPTYGRPAAQRVASAYENTQASAAPQRHPLSTVADVMTRGALTISPRATVEEAWALLSRHRVGQVPVLGDNQQVVGLLLRSDIAPLSLRTSLPEEIAQQRVQEVMLTPVPAVSEQTSLRHLAYVLMDTGLPGLPVVQEQGLVIGFVSRTDILRAVAANPPLDLWS
ncbi:MAG: CBS domain-containing protein [Comamonas sp.]|nr:CBS domain-containing protein [Comamonas sp.]